MQSSAPDSRHAASHSLGHLSLHPEGSCHFKSFFVLSPANTQCCTDTFWQVSSFYEWCSRNVGCSTSPFDLEKGSNSLKAGQIVHTSHMLVANMIQEKVPPGAREPLPDQTGWEETCRGAGTASGPGKWGTVTRGLRGQRTQEGRTTASFKPESG